MAAWFKPAQNGANIGLAFAGLDSTKESVLENAVETEWRRVTQEIGYGESGRELGGPGSLVRQTHRAWRNIVAKSAEVGLRPGSHVVAGPAAGHAYGASDQIRVRHQKINQSR